MRGIRRWWCGRISIALRERARTLHHHPAIHGEALTGDVLRLTAGEECDRGSDIVHLAKLSERDLTGHGGLEAIGQHFSHIRTDEARRDCVTGDAAAGEFTSDTLRETQQACLRGCVVCLACVAHQSSDGSDVDDPAGALLE